MANRDNTGMAMTRVHIFNQSRRLGNKVLSQLKFNAEKVC